MTYPTDHGPITLKGEAATRAAEILVRRGWATIQHSSPHCACGFNEVSELYIDPICRREEVAT